MAQLIDEVGNQYGRLVVLRRDGSDGYGQAAWRCLCSCGKEITTRGGNLRNGRTRSCGCLQKEIRGNMSRLPKGIAAFNQLFRTMKYQARLRGYVWDLTEKQVHELTSQSCFYCGVQPAQILHHPGTNGDFIYNGLDRVDNTKGYIMENVVSCCGTCNKAKLSMTYDEFFMWVSAVYKHLVEEKSKWLRQ